MQQPAPRPSSSGKVIKILLVIGLLGVLGVGSCVAAVYIWFRANKDELAAMGEKARSEGTEVGATVEDRGCIDATLTRLEGCDGLMCDAEQSLFMGFCLQEARATDGFCVGVPRPGEVVNSVSWRLARCAELGLADRQSHCSTVTEAWQQHCAKQH